jgi:uncharacterized phage protein (TIGR02218 family)
MKTYSVALRGHLRKSVTHLATCIRFTRRDLRVYGFSDHDKLLTIGGIDYHPAASFNPSDIESGSNLDTDNLSMEGVVNSDYLTEDELRAGRWDYAEFRVFQVNYLDLSMGEKKDGAGHLGEVRMKRTFVADMLRLMEAYATSAGKITQATCRTNLGSTECGVDLGGTVNDYGSPGVGSPGLAMTVTGTIGSAGADRFTLTDGNRTEPSGFFDEGVLTITSGIAIGLQYEVKAYTQGQWTTKTRLAYDMTGFTYTMTMGCDRRFSTCSGVFGNASNFRGEPNLRGNDVLMQVGRHNG